MQQNFNDLYSGPFRAVQIRDGDYYELSNGNPIQCMSTEGEEMAGVR